MLNNTIIGIDIAKAKFDVFATHHGKSYKHVFQNTPSGFNAFMEWTVRKKLDGAHACLEATGSYGERLSNFLFEKGLKVSVVNPARIKAYGRCNMTRHKTDEVDAKLIAHFCETQKPDLWSPPPKEEYELRELTRCLASLKSSRDDFSNRLEKLEHKGDVVSKHYVNIRSKIDNEINSVSQEINTLVSSSPILKNRHDLLVSIIGIGSITASALLGELLDFSRFKTARQLASFAGLTPSHRQSGSSLNGKSRISKMGSKNFRVLLYFPAISAKNHNPHLKNFSENLKKRGKHNMEIIVAIMRKLIHIAFGVLKNNIPFDSKICEED